MEKMKKILSKSEKRTLRLLVEEFFERDQGELSAKFSADPEYARHIWEHLDRAFFKDSIWLDEIDAAEKNQIHFPSLVLEYHAILILFDERGLQREALRRQFGVNFYNEEVGLVD